MNANGTATEGIARVVQPPIEILGSGQPVEDTVYVMPQAHHETWTRFRREATSDDVRENGPDFLFVGKILRSGEINTESSVITSLLYVRADTYVEISQDLLREQGIEGTPETLELKLY